MHNFHKMITRLVLVVLLVTAGVACKHNKHANTTVKNRAMFDFPCPKDELTLVVADVQGARKMATQIAAYGCGKKAVYVYVPNTNTWILNGAVSEIPEDFDMDAAVTEGGDKKRVQKKASKAQKKGKMDAPKATPAEPAPVEAAPDPS